MKEYLSKLEIKNELIKMLQFFDEFCTIHGINYSIMSGTMLGTIRHNGFIPWDDDIDVGLLRPDYDKLIKILKNNERELNNGKFIFIGHEINKSDKPYIKMINKEIFVKGDDPADRYLWIDLFPFDGMPRHSRKLYQLYFKKYLRRARDFKIDNLYRFILKNQKNIAKRLYCFVVNSIYRKRSLNNVNAIIIEKAKRLDVNTSDYVQDIVWGTKPVPRYLFDDLVDYQFENITVKGFKDYDTYLTCIYGDYMKLPPEDQRVNHGIKAWRVNSDEE